MLAIAWSGVNRGSIGRLILAGIAISALFAAGTTSILTAYPDRVQSAIFFLAGGLTSRGLAQLEVVWPYAAAGLVLAALLIRPLDRLALGDDVAALARRAAAGDPAGRGGRGRAARRRGGGARRPAELPRPRHPARRAARRRDLEPRLRRPGLGARGARRCCCSATRSRASCSRPRELPVGPLMVVLGVPLFLWLLRKAI